MPGFFLRCCACCLSLLLPVAGCTRNQPTHGPTGESTAQGADESGQGGGSLPDGKETRDTVALAPRAYVVDAAVTPASLRLKGAARGAPRQLVHLRQEVLTYWNKETGIRLTVNERMIAHLLAYESAHLEEDQLLSEVLGVWDDSGPLLLLEAREPTAPSLNTPKR